MSYLQVIARLEDMLRTALEIVNRQAELLELHGIETDDAGEICRLMGQRADWLPGLQLRVDGYTCRTYRKE